MKIVCKSNNQSFEIMKRSVFSLMIVCACAFLLSAVFESKAQTGYTYTPWRETDVLPNGQPQPLDFMTLGDQNHKYVECRYGSSWDNPTQTRGVTGSGVTASHLLITNQGADPTRCYRTSTGFVHENVLPRSWDGNPEHFQEKVIRVGCYSHSGSQCTKSQQIEYWFYPPKDSSVLLVYFTFSEEDKCQQPYGHDANYNPQFSIEVLDGQTGSLVTNGYGYYRRCNSNTQTPTGAINNAWPYNRFLAVPSGTDYNQDSQCGPDDNGYTTYYWAYPQATPTTFPFRECPGPIYSQIYTGQGAAPGDQTGGMAGSDIPRVLWFEYKPLAFDLTPYANSGQSVKIRIRVMSCHASAHWAYGMFAAKLIPRDISVDACGDNAINLSVPWGFLENTYEWHYGKNPENSASTLEPGETAGITGTRYNLSIDPTASGARVWPYYRCEMKSYSGVPFTYEAYIKKYEIIPDFEYEQITDPDYPCSQIIQLHNTGSVNELVPNENGQGYISTEQTPIRNIEWYYKNSQGEYQEIPGSRGQMNPRFNVSNTADIDLTNFDFNPGGDSIMIKLIMQDTLQKCSDTLERNIGLDPTFVKVGTKDTTVFACNSQLPYFFGRDKYGDAYRWDAQGKKECHVGEDFDDKSWNYCDSVVSVTLEVMTPKVEIIDVGDYCDSFRTTLAVVPAPNQVFEQEDIHVLSWNGDQYATGTHYLAEHAGAYSVDVAIGDAGCKTSASYKIAACMPFMNLPNTITPSNHDGVNDYFEIPQKSLVQSLEFTVYNRNGTIVYQTKDVNFKWRGARFSDDYPEQELTNQTYVYTLKMVDYNGKPYPVIKGVIVVL